MQIVDAHHHLWDLSTLRYPWLEDESSRAPYGDFSLIRRSYLIGEYLQDIAHQHVVKSVHLQSEHDRADPVSETRWLQSIADDTRNCGFPHGIVAFADLADSEVEHVLQAHCEYRNVRGIRQILSHHADPTLAQAPRNYLDDPRWQRNFRLLAKFGLSFDLQLYHHQMDEGAALAARNSNTLIIVNHAGTPAERDAASLAGWRRGMRLLAGADNVAVKISGLGMFDPHWSVDSIRPFVLETIEVFGSSRCMFGSNFPVDKLFSNYDRIFDAFKTITKGFSDGERRQLFCDNALRYYRL